MSEIDLGQRVFTFEEIERGLYSLPSLISRKGVEVAEAEALVKQMKHHIAMVEAAKTIELRTDDEKVSPTVIKAMARHGDPQIYEELIFAEKEYELRKGEFGQLRDYFDSVRKAANLMVEERKSQAQTIGRGSNWNRRDIQ